MNNGTIRINEPTHSYGRYRMLRSRDSRAPRAAVRRRQQHPLILYLVAGVFVAPRRSIGAFKDVFQSEPVRGYSDLTFTVTCIPASSPGSPR